MRNFEKKTSRNPPKSHLYFFFSDLPYFWALGVNAKFKIGSGIKFLHQNRNYDNRFSHDHIVYFCSPTKAAHHRNTNTPSHEKLSIAQHSVHWMDNGWKWRIFRFKSSFVCLLAWPLLSHTSLDRERENEWRTDFLIKSLTLCIFFFSHHSHVVLFQRHLLFPFRTMDGSIRRSIGPCMKSKLLSS